MTEKEQQLATLESTLKQVKAEFRFWKKAGMPKEMKDLYLKNEEEIIQKIKNTKLEAEYSIH